MGRLNGLADIVNTARAPHAQPAPKGWEPGIAYRNGIPDTITTPLAPEAHDTDAYQAMMDRFGWPLPPGARLELVEARFDPVAWTRDTTDQAKAVTRPAWRYRFKVITDPAAMTRADMDALVKLAARGKGTKPPAPAKSDAAYVVAIADPQIGKAAEGRDGDQGTESTIQRLLDTLEVVAANIRKARPAEIVLIDAGDPIENCFSTPQQQTSNDLDVTEQLRVWRRILMRYVTRLAPLTPSLTVVGVPSNHGQFRVAQKVSASGPWDDFGLDCMAAVQDAIELAIPDAEITFAYPRRNEETVCIPAAGTNIGVAHGHRAGSADRIPDWIGKQAAGRLPLADAHVVVTGHFHHFRAMQITGGRFWLQCPTIDPGSAWLTRQTGEWSAPGLLTFQTAHGRVWDVRVN